MCLAIVEAKLLDGTTSQARCTTEPDVTKAVDEAKADESVSKVTIYRPAKTMTKKVVWTGDE